MSGSVIRINPSILRRGAVLAAVAALGGAMIDTAPASARPPRPGAHACTLPGVDGGLSVTDGTEIEITIAVPPSQGGGTAKLRYVCDNGKWVQMPARSTVRVPALLGALNGPTLSADQLAMIRRSANVMLAVKPPGASLKVIAKPTP